MLREGFVTENQKSDMKGSLLRMLSFGFWLEDGIELYQSLAEYFSYYNHERRHSGINNQMPDQKYNQQLKKAA